MGKIHFALTFLTMNAVFYPMHILGMRGMPRRYAEPYSYNWLKDLLPMNQFMTICAFVLFAVQIIFVVNFFYSLFAGKKAGRNPWNSNTLEWAAPSPPGHGNFAEIPNVYRGPYDYGNPDVENDWNPQWEAGKDGKDGGDA